MRVLILMLLAGFPYRPGSFVGIPAVRKTKLGNCTYTYMYNTQQVARIIRFNTSLTFPWNPYRTICPTHQNALQLRRSLFNWSHISIHQALF